MFRSLERYRSLAYVLLPLLAVPAVGCDAPPEDGAPSAEVRVRGLPPTGDTLVDPQTGERYKRNPNRRVLSAEEASGLVSSAGQVVITRNETFREGKVSTQVVACTEQSFLGRQQFGCDVDPAFVVVGGGASVGGDELSAGAVLQETRPFNHDLFTWVARSTHNISRPDPHQLTVFVIGLRLDGVSADDLWGRLRVSTERKGPGKHLDHFVSLPSADFAVLGGGAAIHSGVNSAHIPCDSYLTHSAPAANGWKGAGKDHVRECNSFLDVTVIGIPKEMPDIFGNLEVVRPTPATSTFNTGGKKSVFVDLPGGFVPTGVGAEANWGAGQGRLLVEIASVGRGARMTDREYLVGDSTGSIAAHVIGIRCQSGACAQ